MKSKAMKRTKSFKILFALLMVMSALIMFRPAVAAAYAAETPSWGSANLISYADSDFESGTGNWANYANAVVSQDTATAYLHNDSLKMTAVTAGSAAIKMGAGTNATQVNVTGGYTYKVSAWVKTPNTGRTLTYAAGFYTSAGTWLGWSSGTTVTLTKPGTWQYVSETITAPSTAAYMLGSPRITETSMTAGESLNIDEVMVTPYRAATLIGAEDTSGNASAFSSTNAVIGPLQSDKVFYSPTHALPSSFTGSICDKLPVNVTCVISYKVQNTNVASFVGSIPAGRNVLLEWWQEPENDTFSGSGSNGQNFVTDFEAQSNLIRSSTTAANRANVMVADNAGTYQYAAGTNHNLGGAGGSCSFTVPGSYVDMYLADLYEFTASGNNVSVDSGAQSKWNGWLNCVSPNNKPIGVAEYGLNCGGSNTTGYNPNSPTTATAMVDDARYFASNPAGLPVILWEYWYDNNAGCEFTSTDTVNQWKANETQNGGGAN